MAEMVCIQCPLSCRLTVTGTKEQVSVSGNRCPRGRDYALAELRCPMRSLTTTVRTIFADCPRLPVRSAGEIPLAKVFSVMEALNQVEVRARLQPGDVVLTRIPGTQVPLIATADMTGGTQNDEQAAVIH